MIKRTKILHKKKICKVCGKPRYIFSHGRCQACASKTYGMLSNVRKPTGELELFKFIWKHHDSHNCIICNKHIKRFSHNNFAHLLSKAAYPSLRLAIENIELMCDDNDGSGCHYKYDTKAESDLTNENNPHCWQWMYIFLKAAELKRVYYKSKITKK